MGEGADPHCLGIEATVLSFVANDESGLYLLGVKSFFRMILPTMVLDMQIAAALFSL